MPDCLAVLQVVLLAPGGERHLRGAGAVGGSRHAGPPGVQRRLLLPLGQIQTRELFV